MGRLWRRVFLFSLLGFLSGTVSDDIGGPFYRNHTISLSGSPYNVTNEIIVGETATLTIEAGVRLLFPEGVGMTVWGRLIAVGTPEHRIVFDRKRNPPDDQANNVTRDHNIRLLGPTVLEGRVQVKLNGTWGSLCLSSRSWRSSEATVVCRQLGFATGRVEDKYRFGRGRMAVCDLECRGNEDNIYECNHDDHDLPPACRQGRNRRDLGVVCDGLNHRDGVYWKAIDIRTTNEAMKSILDNVAILHAGGANPNAESAAIVSTSVPPLLHNVTIKYSGDAALRVNDLTTTFQMENCDISENHGVGLIIKNPSANVTISSSTFSKNFPVGMQVTGGHTGSTLQITDSMFEQNSGAGLMLSDAPMNVDIRQSNFSTNSHYGLSVFTTTRVNLVTDSCHFDHNGLDGFHARYLEVSGDRSRTVLHNDGAIGNVGRGFDLEIEYQEYQNIMSSPISDQVIIDQSDFASNENGSVRLTVDNSYEDRFPVVQLTGGVYQDNMATIVEVGGTHTEVTIQDSEFDSSQCSSKSVIHVHGYDKTVNITGNRFVRNVCRRVVLFNTTDVTADVHPLFVEDNIFENNEYEPDSLAHLSDPLNEYCTIEVVGSGEENTITQNSFLNSPHGLELCISDGSHQLAVTQIRAENNWWGTTDINSIKEKIFDNNDWYSGSEIKFFPYLDSPSGSPISTVDTETMTASSLGGRLNGTLHITTSDSPVTLTRDLTILPDSVLSVEAGVEFRVQERVGILNLGKLQLDGLPSSPITFDVARKTVSNRTVPVRLTGGSIPGDGRLEVQYSGQWVPVCYYWHSEFATIACRQLGLGPYTSAIGYGASNRNWLTVRCDGSEDNIGECSLYHTSRCGSSSSHLRLTCDPTPGWGGIVSLSNQTFEPNNINLFHVGHVHLHKAPGISIQGSQSTNVLNNVLMDSLVGGHSGIEYLDLKRSQLTTLHGVTLASSGNREGVGIDVKSLDSLSWWELEADAGSRLLPLLKMCSSPTSLLLSEGQSRWIVNGIKKKARLQCLKTVRVQKGYSLRLTVTRSSFSHPPSRNSLTVYDSHQLNETSKLGSVDYYNQVSSSGLPRVFTSSAPVMTLSLKASTSQNAFFVARLDVMGPSSNSTYLDSMTTLRISDFRARNFDYGIQIKQTEANVHIENSLFLSENNRYGIVITSLSGDVTLSNVSVADNDYGISASSIDGTISISNALIHSNSYRGLLLQNIQGLASLTDVTVTKNGRSSYSSIQIQHTISQHGSYYLSNITCRDNNWYGIDLDLSYDTEVGIYDSHIEENRRGGIRVNSREVQSDQHPIVGIYNNNITANERFALQVTGWHRVIDFEGNTMSNNRCPYQPAMKLGGQAQNLSFMSNTVMNNNARETLSLAMTGLLQSLTPSEIKMERNIFEGNFFDPSLSDGNQYEQHPDNTSCTIEVGGYKQSVQIHSNIFNDNGMDYTVCSRFHTDSPDWTIKASHNWWGTTIETEIRNKISDFDDWNDRAPVDYFPYLTGPDVSSPPADPSSWDVTMATDSIGGRLYHSFHLRNDGGPYIIKADLTVLKNASLTIDPGSIIKVHPCVGLLSLGSLVVQGALTEPIYFDLADVPVPVHQPQVRLVGGRYPWEGRVEVFYNGEWGTVCGVSYWNTQDANVICRELGFERYLEYQTYSFGPGTGQIWIGRYTSRPDCVGHEMSIFNCLQGAPGNTDSSCTHANDVGVRCAPNPFISPRPICTTKKWGGIKANSNDSNTLKHIVIRNTGSLHGSASSGLTVGAAEEVANVSSIHISECEGIGLEVVGGKRSTAITDVTIQRCFGDTGISIVGRKSYMAASQTRFVENNFLVGSINLNVPSATREMTNDCQDRVTIVASKGTITSVDYGQSNYPNNLRCEWLIVVPRGSVILRFIHINTESGYDYVTIYDGPTTSSASLGRFEGTTMPPSVVSSSREVFVTFRTDGSVRREGFELEFTSTESGDVDDEDVCPCAYTIQDSMFRNNSGSSINITAVGDATLDIQRNVFSQSRPRGENDEDAVIYSSGNIDNVTLSLRSNHLADSTIKGLYLNAWRHGVGTITVLENQFFRNKAGALMMIGGNSQILTPCRLWIKNNVFSSNEASDSENIISIDNLAGNLENNTFFNNSGHYMVNWQGGNASDSQLVCENNLLYDNIGMMPGEKYTMVVSGRAVKLHGNVLTNPANDAELATSLRITLHPVNATYNWWGFTSRNVIESRIRDENDQHEWAEVLFDPWAHDAPRDGPCDLGWTYSKVLSTCYRYMGGSQTWDNAVKSCQEQLSIIVRSFSGLEKTTLANLLASREAEFLPGIPVWMEKGVKMDNSSASCKTYHPTFNGVLQTVTCTSYYPFFCKRPVVDDCPNSCSHHGSCEGQTCNCQRGWEGEDCSQFTCSDRNSCGEFGTCVGPNICRCRNGWQGRACTVSYCNRFTNCKSCTRETGCGWCEQRQSCESGLCTGPDVTPCNAWFYHGCFTVGQRYRCSKDIEIIDCGTQQCNTELSTTTVESCLRCQDIEGCFKESNEDYCNVWNEDQCPKGFIHSLYNDTTRIGKILIGHNVEYVPLEGNILYRCPVRFSSWGATMFVNEGDLDIRIGQVLSSPQANGVLHKVEQEVKIDNYTVIVAHPATLEDMLDYSDFSQEVQLEMAVDMKRNEGLPEVSVVERVLNGNGTLDGSTVRVITEDASVYKCIGARAMNEGEGSYHLLMRDIPDHLFVGDVIVSNHSNGILEQVTQQTTTPHGVFIQTQLQDCFTTFNFREELEAADGATLPASLPCSGGPEGAHGLLIVDSAGKGVNLQVGNVVVGRRSGGLLAKVLNITTAAEFTLVEVEPILSRSTMTMASRRRRREDVTVSPARHTLELVIEDQFSDVTDSYSIELSSSGELSAGIKLSLAVSTSEFRTPTLKKTDVFFVGGRLNVGLEGSLDVLERIWTSTRGAFRTELSPTYASLCVSETLCIPAKLWADIVTSYQIYAEGPGSIQMSSNVVKPDIDGGGSWQPQEGGQFFTFDQNEESDSANIVISSFSGTAAESGHLIILELKVKPTFFIEFPTSGESEEHEWTIPIDVTGQEGAFGYSITTSLQSEALLRVSAQSCSTECPYSDRPQYVGVTSSLDYLKGAFNVIAGNNDYYQEQQWRREEWIDSDRDCKSQSSSTDICTHKCSCPGGATGMPHPTNESFCMCPCDCGSGNTSFTHPSTSGCNCELCPDGDFKTVNSQGDLHCPCLCPDNKTSELTSNGKCDCSCICPDGSRDVVLSDGSCPCRCTCNNCHESVLGPQGCICSDSCPDCENDEESEWQDCVCKCPQKTECGIPPTCVVGRMGPDCRQPDCRPCQGCSGNGRCTTSADSCQSSCACWPQWFGDCCELRRPRPIGGDPHLQTLDGMAYDYHGIGEFWDCKSVSNDFGVQTRMYAYERASLIGGVAVKTGHSVVTLMTLPIATEKDVPGIRIDGELRQLAVGEKYLLNNGTIHLLAQQPSTNATESGAVIIVSITFASGATVSFDVRYSPKMGRQFVNILFSPTATFKGTTEGLCGLMDDDDANDLTGPDGAVYNDSSIFAETWRISTTHHGSGLMGSWSWNSSNFHPDDVMDPAYSDPAHRPSVGIDGLTQEEKEKAEEMCIALGLTGNLLNECIFDVSITNDTTFTEQEVFKGCPNQCSGRGRCVNGTCDCITGWSGEDCNLGNCTDCSEDHGRCELGFCRCEPGWEGTACDQQATCYAVRNCTSMVHGICVSKDVCKCKPGYIGDDCSKVPTCGNVANCTDHGACVDYDICLCDEQWTGDKCDQFSCAALDHCSGHGRCVDIDVCYCEQGWTGSSCVTPDCPAVNQCSRQGDCIGPNICQCYSGYQGLNCSQAQGCPELQECNENGACVFSSEGQPECRCFPGFSGASCDQPDCTVQNNCTDHGSCIEPNLCQCDSGYTGGDCANVSCESLRYCSGHGSCVSFDTCSCDTGWSGSSCNIANCTSKAECSSQGTCVAPNTCECFPGFQGEDCSEENLPNENPPIFLQERYDATIPENQPVVAEASKWTSRCVSTHLHPLPAIPFWMF